MPSILLQGLSFNYDIKKSWRRSISLKLLSSTSFQVSVNHLTPQIIIDKFIHDHTNWILKNSSKVTTYPDLLNLPFISILDKNYQLIIIPSKADKITIDQINYTIDVFTKYLTQAHLKQVIGTHLKKHARHLIESEIKLLQTQYNFQFGRLSLRNQSTRFGSCSSTGNLNFNWQIIFFPYDKFCHIICHELAHLTHHNHSKSFWNLLALYDPNWKANNKWLKTNGHKYYIIKP